MGGIEQREGEPLEEFEKRLRQEIAESKKKWDALPEKEKLRQARHGRI